MIYYSIKLNGVPHFVQEDIRISKLKHCMTLKWQPEKLELSDRQREGLLVKLLLTEQFLQQKN